MVKSVHTERYNAMQNEQLLHELHCRQIDRAAFDRFVRMTATRIIATRTYLALRRRIKKTPA